MPKVTGALAMALGRGLQSPTPPPTHDGVPLQRLLGGPWNRWYLEEERHSLERVHAKGHIHAWAVGQEGRQGRLLKQAKDQDLVPAGTVRAGPREGNLRQGPNSALTGKPRGGTR